MCRRSELIESYGVRYQQYADDTQLYVSMRAEDAAAAQGLDTLKLIGVMSITLLMLVKHIDYIVLN